MLFECFEVGAFVMLLAIWNDTGILSAWWILKTAIDVDCILSEALGNKNALKIVTSFLFRHPKFSFNEYFQFLFEKHTLK